MGQSNSNDKRKQVKGGIYVDIPKSAYISNEVVQGLLHLNLEEQYQGHILVISLEGFEETCFRYSTGTGKDRKTHTARGKKRFLNYSMPIFDFAQNDGSPNFMMQPGQWSIPFSLKIGDKLPSTVEYYDYTFHHCSIKYNICAYIIPNDPNNKPIQGNQPIFIGQYIEKGVQSITKTIQTAPSICCCFGTGNIDIKCAINQQSLAPKEEMIIKLSGDFKNCSKDIKRIKVELNGQLKMKADNNFRNNVDNIEVISTLIPVTGKEFNQEVKILVPQNTTLSSQGELLSLQYFVKITPQLDASCVSGNDSLIIDVQINPTPQFLNNLQYPQLLKIQTPQVWNPIKLEQEIYSEQQQLKMQEVHLNFSQNQQEYLYYVPSNEVNNQIPAPLMK